MSTISGQMLLYSGVPVGAALAGSLIATVKPPTLRVRSYVQHFAAGVVFSVLAVEILPDVVHRRAPFAAMFGFVAGVATMLLIRHLAGNGNARNGSADVLLKQSSAGLLAAMGLDVFIDGLLLGASFIAGEKTSVLLALALATELLALSLATVSSLHRSHTTRLRSLLLSTLISFLLPLGLILATALVSRLSELWMEGILSFATAALLFLVTEELLVEAHEVPETPVATAMFFIGFLALMLIDMAAS